MDCKKAKACMNEFIENTLNEKDMLDFSEHIGKCGECMEEFLICSSIAEEFENEELNKNAPTDFEFNVMKKISGIEFKTDKILSFLIGAISVYMGIFMIVSFNMEFVRRIIESDSYIEAFAEKANDIIVFINGIFEGLSDILSKCNFSLRNFSLAIFILLIGAKIIRSRLNRGGDRA